MNQDTEHLRTLITGMRAAYERSENVMAFARNHTANLGGGGISQLQH